MRVPYLVIASTLSFMPFQSISGEALTGDQIKSLFYDKTYDIEKVDVNKNKYLSAYNSSDGTRIVFVPWKNKRSKRKWWVEGNKLCADHPKRGDYCREIVRAGDDAYHSIENGKHLSTVSNFRDGNQL